MALKLHVWGPAFGLPSIDAECNAAIAYMNSTIPQDQWCLIADYDTSITPRGAFPTLIDGEAVSTGFPNIVSYLREHPTKHRVLDSDLNAHQQTDILAYTSLLQSTAVPLIDLSLYVSSENYNAITTSSYTAILPWYLNYTIPPERRDLARLRTSHLGLSSLDVQAPDKDDDGIGLGNDFESRKRAAGIPGDGHVPQGNVLNMGRAKGIQGLLSSPVYAARFRLDSLTNELLEPLAHLLGSKKYLLTNDKPSSLDCVAFGYLSLMLYPPVPQSWLRDAITKRFPRVHTYVIRLREEFVGTEEVSAKDIWYDGRPKSLARQKLPWQRRPSRSIIRTITAVSREISTHAPIIANIFPATITMQDMPKLAEGTRSSLPSAFTVNLVFGLSAAMTATLLGLAAHHKRSPREGNMLIFWALQRPNSGLGEAGNILSILAHGPPR